MRTGPGAQHGFDVGDFLRAGETPQRMPGGHRRPGRIGIRLLAEQQIGDSLPFFLRPVLANELALPRVRCAEAVHRLIGGRGIKADLH